MNDEQFESVMRYFESIDERNFVYQLRERDTVQRESLSEALGMLHDLDKWWNAHDGEKKFGRLMQKVESLVDRHIQAEQQEVKPVAAQEAQAGEFKREQRYMVIKLNKLADDQGTNMSRREQIFRIAHFGRAMVECVVVESDWPEFEPTWAAIQARVRNKLEKGDEDLK